MATRADGVVPASMTNDGQRMPVEAIAEAYELYRTELHSFLSRRSRNKHDVDDLLQEIFLQLLRFPPREVLREPQSYLFRIAWHVVNQANLRAQKEASSHVPAMTDTGNAFDAERATRDISEGAIAAEQLMNALSELPRAMRAAIVLFKRDGLSYKEIAVELGVSVHTVKKYIARAVVHFKNHAKGSQP